jgi:hypothetical protein
MSDHQCPGPNCNRRVPQHMLACRTHWFSVPAPLRAKVWSAAYRAGPGSEEHTAACVAAIEAMH